VQLKDSLNDLSWQTLSSISGDGTRKQVTNSPAGANGFYRISSQ